MSRPSVQRDIWVCPRRALHADLNSVADCPTNRPCRDHLCSSGKSVIVIFSTTLPRADRCNLAIVIPQELAGAPCDWAALRFGCKVVRCWQVVTTKAGGRWRLATASDLVGGVRRNLF